MAALDGQLDSFDLDALAVSDRFRLFAFTRRAAPPRGRLSGRQPGQVPESAAGL